MFFFSINNSLPTIALGHLDSGINLNCYAMGINLLCVCAISSSHSLVGFLLPCIFVSSCSCVILLVFTFLTRWTIFKENDRRSSPPRRRYPRAPKEDQTLFFRTATAKSVYPWIVKPQTAVKLNEMFLPGRMAFIFSMGKFLLFPMRMMRLKCPHIPMVEYQSIKAEEYDIFIGEGVEYAIPSKVMSQIPVSEDMEESPRNRERTSYFNEPAYGPVPPPELSQEWQRMDGYHPMQAQAQAAASGYQGEWQDYQYSEQLAYPDQYLQQNLQAYDGHAELNVQDPHFMTQEEKDHGLGSVFKRDD